MTTVDEPDELSEQFLRACDYVAAHSNSMSMEQLIPLYGYYKQATVGPCNTAKPSAFNIRAKTMWKSWREMGSLSKEDAMRAYVRGVREAAGDRDQPSAAQMNRGWVSVSSPSREEEIPDSSKDIFDWVKEGNLKRIRQLNKKFDGNLKDESGLFLLHWASDRGHLNVVEYLILEMKANVNCVDGNGQTPLHYAAACGHLDISKFLVNSRADVAAKDGDGLSPVDVIEESAVKKTFEKLFGS